MEIAEIGDLEESFFDRDLFPQVAVLKVSTLLKKTSSRLFLLEHQWVDAPTSIGNPPCLREGRTSLEELYN